MLHGTELAARPPGGDETRSMNMNGPPLTPREAVASVAQQVRRLHGEGLDRNQAVRRVAAEHGIEPHAVAWCVARFEPVTPVALPRRRPRWAVPALATALVAVALGLTPVASANAATLN